MARRSLLVADRTVEEVRSLGEEVHTEEVHSLAEEVQGTVQAAAGR